MCCLPLRLHERVPVPGSTRTFLAGGACEIREGNTDQRRNERLEVKLVDEREDVWCDVRGHF